MSTDTTLLSHAGDEATVRDQVEAAMAESKPLPVWQETLYKPRLDPIENERHVAVKLTLRTAIGAWFWRNWIPTVHTNLSPREELTAAVKLEILREALAEIDAARPVLVRLIESAEAAL